MYSRQKIKRGRNCDGSPRLHAFLSFADYFAVPPTTTVAILAGTDAVVRTPESQIPMLLFPLKLLLLLLQLLLLLLVMLIFLMLLMLFLLVFLLLLFLFLVL